MDKSLSKGNKTPKRPKKIDWLEPKVHPLQEKLHKDPIAGYAGHQRQMITENIVGHRFSIQKEIANKRAQQRDSLLNKSMVENLEEKKPYKYYDPVKNYGGHVPRVIADNICNLRWVNVKKEANLSRDRVRTN